MPKKKDTVTTLDMDSRKVTAVSFAVVRPHPLFRRTHQAGALFGQGRLSHLASVHEPVHLHVHSESRSALPSKHEECSGATWASECLVAHTAPAGCRVAHPPVVAGHTFRTMCFATGSYHPYHSASHTHRSRRKHHRYQRNNHTKLAEGEDVGCGGRIPRRDRHPFLVRGSCRVHNVHGGCRCSIHFQACSRLATGTGVHRVRQTSDVHRIESGRQHFGHVAEGRDSECRKDESTKFPNATCGTSMMLRPFQQMYCKMRKTRRQRGPPQHVQSCRNSRRRSSFVLSCL